MFDANVVVGSPEVTDHHQAIADLWRSVTRTKILLPRRRPDLLTRERLINILYDLLDFKLILIAAPAGYGKTSLLIDLAHEIELAVCWYTLDSLDHDPRRFISHFIAAIAHRFPHFGDRTAAILRSATGDLDLDLIVKTLVNEIYDHIQEYFVLFLDDYHLVNSTKEVSVFVNQFLQQVGENCHMVIASRTLLTLPDLPLMVARSQVGGLSLDELAFRAEEIQQLVLKNHQNNLARPEAEALVQATEGWITGLLLSTHSRWQGLTDRLRLARVSGVGLYDYLAQQVVNQEHPFVRKFLLFTSIFDAFDADLCRQVLGPIDSYISVEERQDGGFHFERWDDLLETVLRHNLFVLPVGEEGLWLRYHNLFREFLQTQLERSYPQERELLSSRLADVYMQRGDWEGAYQQYWRAGDLEGAANLIEHAHLSFIHSGQFATIADWVDRLPKALVNARPALLSLRGLAAATLGDLEKGMALLNEAEAISRAKRNLPELARTLVRRSVAHRFRANYQTSLADADEALTLTDELEDLQIVRTEALRAKAISFYRLSKLDQAIESYEHALTAATTIGEAQNIAILHLEIGLVYAGSGSYTKALDYYNQALSHWRQVDNIAWQANSLNNLGSLYHLQGDYERASAALDQALKYAEQSGYTRIQGWALSSIGDLYRDLKAPEAAMKAYEQAIKIAEQIDDRFLILYLKQAQAALHRAEGSFALARDLLEMAERYIELDDAVYETGLQNFEQGILALSASQPTTAITHLAKAVECFQLGGQYTDQARACLYLASAYYTAGDKTTAFARLQVTFDLATRLESWHPLVIPGQEAREMLQAARKEADLTGYVTRLLDQIDQFEANIPTLRRTLRRHSVVPLGPPKLIIQAFGKQKISLDGKPVESQEWRGQRRVRELFFYILTNPEGLTREATSSIFWPDSTSAQIKLQVKNAIYRLRQALGKEVILYDEHEDVYRFNHRCDYEFDVETFLQKIEQAEAETNPQQQFNLFLEATGLYANPYLPDVDGVWAWLERERLWQLYVKISLRVAESLLQQRSYEAALEYCYRLLKDDNCLEEAYRLSMRAYAEMGNQAQVVRQFELCCKALQENINSSPSPQTEKLYKMLTFRRG